jgi:hypothetical protein
MLKEVKNRIRNAATKKRYLTTKRAATRRRRGKYRTIRRIINVS